MMRKRTKPFPWRCPECMRQAVRPAQLQNYIAEVKHDGRVHEFRIAELPIVKCEHCGDELFTLETDDVISAGLRKHLDLLSPEEIRAMRKAGPAPLTQEQFADLLGVATATVSRWESGAVIQSRALDNLLRIVRDVREAREYLQQAHTRVG